MTESPSPNVWIKRPDGVQADSVDGESTPEGWKTNDDGSVEVLSLGESARHRDTGRLAWVATIEGAVERIVLALGCDEDAVVSRVRSGWGRDGSAAQQIDLENSGVPDVFVVCDVRNLISELYRQRAAEVYLATFSFIETLRTLELRTGSETCGILPPLLGLKDADGEVIVKAQTLLDYDLGSSWHLTQSGGDAEGEEEFDKEFVDTIVKRLAAIVDTSHMKDVMSVYWNVASPFALASCRELFRHDDATRSTAAMDYLNGIKGTGFTYPLAWEVGGDPDEWSTWIAAAVGRYGSPDISAVESRVAKYLYPSGIAPRFDSFWWSALNTVIARSATVGMLRPYYDLNFPKGSISTEATVYIWVQDGELHVTNTVPSVSPSFTWSTSGTVAHLTYTEGHTKRIGRFALSMFYNGGDLLGANKGTLYAMPDIDRGFDRQAIVVSRGTTFLLYAQDWPELAAGTYAGKSIYVKLYDTALLMQGGYDDASYTFRSSVAWEGTDRYDYTWRLSAAVCDYATRSPGSIEIESADFPSRCAIEHGYVKGDTDTTAKMYGYWLGRMKVDSSPDPDLNGSQFCAHNYEAVSADETTAGACVTEIMSGDDSLPNQFIDSLRREFQVHAGHLPTESEITAHITDALGKFRAEEDIDEKLEAAARAKMTLPSFVGVMYYTDAAGNVEISTLTAEDVGGRRVLRPSAYDSEQRLTYLASGNVDTDEVHLAFEGIVERNNLSMRGVFADAFCAFDWKWKSIAVET